MRSILFCAALLVLAGCDSPAQDAREEAAEFSDNVVEAQTGQTYEGEGPREQAAEELGEYYDPTPGAVARNPNSPVVADLPAETPEPGEAGLSQ